MQRDRRERRRASRCDDKQRDVYMRARLLRGAHGEQRYDASDSARAQERQATA